MAQADGVVSNASGAAVRADLNNQLAAVFTNHSGATEPTTTYAYQWWADTTTGLLKIRNAANSAWVTVGTMADVNLGLLAASGGTLTGALLAAAGSETLPSIAFSGDTNTGVWSPGSDQIAISTGGSKRIEIQADGDIDIDGGGVFYDATNNRLAVGTTSPAGQLDVVTGAASRILFRDLGVGARIDSVNVGNSAYEDLVINGDPLIFQTVGNERCRLDSSGRLLVGTSSASTFGTTTPSLQNIGNSVSSSSIAVHNNGTDENSRSSLIFAKSADVSGALTSSSAFIGSCRWYGFDGTNYIEAAAIDGRLDGTPGANDMPGRLMFATTADGASSPTERMRISNDGVTDIVAAQSVFRPTSAASAGTTYALINGKYGATLGNPATGTTSFVVYTNGNVINTNNSYGAISDIKLKENVVDASSQWDDIKALRPVNYNFKEGQTHTQLGLIAQEVELVSPGLVEAVPDRDEEGNDIGTVTKSVNYSVLYMKAVKALQEAMERIEQLESEMAAVKAQLA